ncbi:prepilin peptidase [Flaviflexus salsibiostraticola]|uniref:Prepilin peptidase n=1 Tax=Flaviflexus salsibiostraticola TaxID=1282737 RepID=A0A3S8ZC35_9ACTO|nr:prepilin peptidase [Flaviflexus salsibiostraticola]
MALAAALACAASGALLVGQIRPFVQDASRWARSPILPAVLSGTAGLGAAALADGWAELAAFAAVGVGSSLLIVIDLAVNRLPDRLVAATLVALVAGLLVAAATAGDWSSFGRSLLAALALCAGYFTLAFISPSGLGLGDVKFAAVVGAFLGWFSWQHVAVGTLLAFALNFAIALGVLLSRRGGRHTDIPFGPWMVAGAILAVLILGR